MLDLDFTPEQEMLRSAVRDLLGDYCSLSQVRELEDDPVGYSEELWSQMAKLDLVSMMVPEAKGGSEMSMIDATVVYEELGRALAPTPHLVSSVISQSVIARYANDELANRWLEGLTSGQTIVTTAWLEPGGGFGPQGVELDAQIVEDKVVLEGTKHHVPFAKAADGFLVLARTGPKLGDLDIFLVDAKSPGIEMTQVFSVASDTQYEVRFSQVAVDLTSRVGQPGQGWKIWDEIMHEAVVLIAAYCVGAASYALEITVQYAKDRHQFDKPLGAFQALAHYLADAQTNLDGATQLVHEAAWALAERRDALSLAPMAKLFACRTFRDITAMAQQIFGGIGFTIEFDIQLYFRRAKAWQISWWNDRYLEEIIAKSVLD